MKNKFLVSLVVVGLLCLIFSCLVDSVGATAIVCNSSFDNYDGQSGYIEASNANFVSLVNAAVGSYYSYSSVRSYVNVGYTIQRGFLFFNTSSLPDDCVVMGFNLSFYVAYKEGSSPFVYLQSANLGNILGSNDFDKSFYGSLFSRFSISFGYHFYKFCFGLNVSSMINTKGLSCFVIRNSDDYLGVYNTNYFWEITNMSTLSLCVLYVVDSGGFFSLAPLSFEIFLLLGLFYVAYRINQSYFVIHPFLFIGGVAIILGDFVSLATIFFSVESFAIFSIVYISSFFVLVLYKLDKGWREHNKEKGHKKRRR